MLMNLNHGRCLRSAVLALAALTLCGSALAEEAAKPTAAATPKPSPEQTKRTPRPGDVQKVFVVRHVRARILGEVLVAFPATITYSTWGESSGLGVSAPPAVMAAIEEAVKRLDVPPLPETNVEITAYVIEALSSAQADAKVPAFLDSVVAQLRSTFHYSAYRLVDTLVTRATAGGHSKIEADSVSESDIWHHAGAGYALRAFPALLSVDGRRAVRMEQMRFLFQIPVEVSANNWQIKSSEISTAVDVPEGQYVVVGKSGTGQPGSALILVLHAKIID